MSLELNGIITIDKLARYHEKIAAKYASTSDLENYATEEYVDEAIANIEHPLPEVNANHQYLTTNEKGEKVWENQTHYKMFVEEMPLLAESSFTSSMVTSDMSATALSFNHGVNDFNQTVKVTYDGTTYTCVSKEYEPTPGSICLGNPSIGKSDLEDTGEPFLWVRVYPTAQKSYLYIKETASSEHTVSTTLAEHYEYVTLPEEYLSKNIPMLKEGQWGQSLMVATVDANGQPNDYKAVGFGYLERIMFNDQAIYLNKTIYSLWHSVNYLTHLFTNEAKNLALPLVERRVWMPSSSDYDLHSIFLKEFWVIEKDDDIIVHLHFCDEYPDLIIRQSDNSITLDPEWVAPVDIPTSDKAHAQLVTNANGEMIWEDKLCYSYVETTEILAEQTQDKNGYIYKPAQHTVQIGQEYIVTYNGTTYKCLGGDLDGVPVLGNISLMREGSEDTGEPFLLFGLMQNASGFGIFSQDGPHTFSAVGEQIKYKAIDGNYLAGGIFEGTGEHAHVFNGREAKWASGTSSASFNDGDASGYAAFAIGGGTASGMWSFAGGEGAHAKGRNSVAFGHLTVATAEDQLVTGSYNIEDTEKQHAFIIGNGNYQTKANIHTIDWQGNSKYAGDLYVNGTKEQDLADAKKVATEEYVTNAIAAIEIPEASANVNVYEITSDSAVLDELVALLPEGVEIHSGDVMLVTNTMGVKSAYQYDEDWIACDGNVDASKVIMPFDITLAGSYTQVGNLSKTSTGTATFATKGKSVAQAFQEMLSKREQPKIKSNPSVSLTATSGAKEVGTKITPEWSASLNAGSYTYGPATGITASSWEISDTDGNKASTASGKFAEITVGDTTNYRITAKANYAAGAIAVDNLGDPSNPTIQIAAGSKSANGSYITGYRAWFTYVGESLDTINSAFIRGTTNKGSTPATQNGVNIPAGTKRVMIAIPATSSLVLKQVIDVDGMGLDVFGNFTLQTVDVEGLNGYEAKSYNVWVAENTNGMAATHYNFIIE